MKKLRFYLPGLFSLPLILSSAYGLSTSTEVNLTNDTFNGISYYMQTAPNYIGPPVPFTKTYLQYTIDTQDPDHSCQTTSYGMEIKPFDNGTVFCSFTYNIKICVDESNYDPQPSFIVTPSYSNFKNSSGSPDYCFPPTFAKSGSTVSMDVILTSFNQNPTKSKK